MVGKLTGKVALVTGASSGIGEATAIALAAEGASVAIAARRADRLESLEQQITQSGGQALSIVADIADESHVHDAVTKTQAALGRLDILVNNAGLMLVDRVEGANTEDWRRMVNLNLLGLMYATQAVVPLMKQQGGGHIVNMSSIAGRGANSPFAVYSATKFGVGAFSEALRQEVYQDNIRITLIEPGGVATELTNHITNPVAKEQTEAAYSSMTLLEAEDIAAAIVYAVSQPQRVNVNEILIRPTEQQI